MIMVVVASGVAAPAATGQSTASDSGYEPFPDRPDDPTDPRSWSKLAWQQFVAANRAATASPGYTVWESWISAAEVFADPNCQPPWPASRAAKELEEEPVQQIVFAQQLLEDMETAEPRRPAVDTDALAPERSEVHMNRTAYDWITTRGLWYLDGQLDRYHEYRRGLAVDNQFPYVSVVVKAAWKRITASEKPRYHWQMVDGELYGMNALHIASKIRPDWFWATWEHVDNPERELVTLPDLFGLVGGEVSAFLLDLFRQNGLDPDRWKNYRLNGTQLNFVDAEGRPLILANSILENGFTTLSSCMTCHARATIGEDGRRLDGFDPPEVGTPVPGWFSLPSSPPIKLYLPLDFVWSLSRARAATGPCQSQAP